MFTAKHFEVKAALYELLRKPVHLSSVKLDGLVIHVPPKGSKPPATTNASQGEPKHKVRFANFVINKLDADGTVLYVLKRDPSREPMEFDIRKLTLRSAGIGQPMTYKADLTNDTPPGLVHSTGSFGPWNFDEPSATKLSGRYRFDHADLSVFNGVSGILLSVGEFTGELNNIVVDGTTDTPDFRLDRGAQQVHLATEFHAVVDGTKGDTYLQPVSAHFLKSTVVANAEIAGKAGQKGKTISLDIAVQDSRLQDLLDLASKTDGPAVTGSIDFQGHVTLPPGNEVVLKKLQMDGTFHVRNARFNDDSMSNAIDELSRRGHAGSYRIQSQALCLRGRRAVASNDVTGRRRQEGSGLKPFDPIFMRHAAGTYLPVDIQGSRDHPQVKVQWKELF